MVSITSSDDNNSNITVILTCSDDSELCNLKTEILRTGEAKIYDFVRPSKQLMTSLAKDIKTHLFAVS